LFGEFRLRRETLCCQYRGKTTGSICGRVQGVKYKPYDLSAPPVHRVIITSDFALTYVFPRLTFADAMVDNEPSRVGGLVVTFGRIIRDGGRGKYYRFGVSPTVFFCFCFFFAPHTPDDEFDSRTQYNTQLHTRYDGRAAIR